MVTPGATLPFLLRFQGYIYNNTITSAAGFSVGCQIAGMVALNVGGKLCFWFPYQADWQGFSVFVSTSLAGVKKNCLISIDNSAKPDGASKEFAVSDKITPVLHAANFHNYAPRLNGYGANGTWQISVTGNAATGYVTVTDGDGMLQQFPQTGIHALCVMTSCWEILQVIPVRLIPA
jgi:hypothetical protein